MFYDLVRPLLFRLDAERAHDLALGFAARCPGALARRWAPKVHRVLAQTIHGRQFIHPLGLAAGMDKDGAAIDFWADIGFSFVELGTITPGFGQYGNDKPRMWRVPYVAGVVNKLGFNNAGAHALAARLERHQSLIPYGVSIGKARDTSLDEAHWDYALCAQTVGERVAPQYFAINISSPNTEGLRALQDTVAIARIVGAVRGVLPACELALKLAPDLADLDVRRIAELAMDLDIRYLIATNTTTMRQALQGEDRRLEGGLSGPALTMRALEITKILYRVVGASIPIIGVGGIDSAASAMDRIRAGASLLQLYTALVYRGPGIVREIVDGLAARCGNKRISHFVGQAA